MDQVISLNKFSNLNKLIKVYRLVLIFVNKLKSKVKNKYPDKFIYISMNNEDHNYFDDDLNAFFGVINLSILNMFFCIFNQKSKS